ncbi:MAG: right-handed parallel beta-helix repeat-containing protein [bacterium]|nr:right-handed parallel beta-helix repeat-containing protein [bacterium]
MTRRLLPAALALAAALASSAAAEIRYVNDATPDPFQCEGAPYSTIGAALAVSQAGDEIRICPGVYPEQIVVTTDIRLTGVPLGTARPLIRPTALPTSRPSLLGGAPVTGAIIADAESARIRNLDVDLGAIGETSCTPLLTGVYLRNASGIVEDVNIRNVYGGTACDSGVGLYVESGQIRDELGKPILGLARVIIRSTNYEGYRKAGLVGAGPRTILSVKGGTATGPGDGGGIVPYGLQIGFDAKARVSGFTTSGNRSSDPARAAAGFLVWRTDQITIRKSSVTDSDEGILVVGDRVKVKKNKLSGLGRDGLVLLGDANIATGNLIEATNVSGAFINGSRNTVRGGVMRNLPVGLWFQNGIGNRFGGVRFDVVPKATQGLEAGIRADMTEAAAAPFTTN